MQPDNGKFLLGERPKLLKPRKLGFTYMPLIAIARPTGMPVGMLETGEVIDDLCEWVQSADVHVWITTEPEYLLQLFLDNHLPGFKYEMPGARLIGKRPDRPSYGNTSPDFFTCYTPSKSGKGKRHRIWNPSYMDPSLNRLFPRGASHLALMRFGQDVRGWLEDVNLPIYPKFTSIASRLMRDERFWPDGKSIVPKVTNENVREYLPANFIDTYVTTGTEKRYNVISIDQKSAYHSIASEVPMPDASTLFVKGNFWQEDSAQVWLRSGTHSYDRVINQPGLLKVQLANPPDGRCKFYPPALDNAFGPERYTHKQGVCYLWTNELDLVESAGVEVTGLIAAWTSLASDDGLAAYAEWAKSEIARASEFRRKWLKPTLHMTYGLHGARARIYARGRSHGKKGVESNYWVGGIPFPVIEFSRGIDSIPTTNVLTLGVLQAEVRARTFRMCNAIESNGGSVLHIHADAIHMDVWNCPPLGFGNDWGIETLTDVAYENKVWWVSNEKTCKPGLKSEAA